MAYISSEVLWLGNYFEIGKTYDKVHEGIQDTILYII